MFYRLNRGTMDDFICNLTGKKPKKNAKPCPSYTDDVFYVTLQYGNAMTEAVALERYGKDEKRKLDIPVTSKAVEMVAETIIYHACRWPNKDRKPHFDELEYAYFREKAHQHSYFIETDRHQDYYAAKTDTSEYGFRNSGHLRNIFYKLQLDLAEYYKALKITFTDNIDMDVVYQALWSLALQSTEKEWPTITAPRVPISKCIYCGETVWSNMIGLLEYAGDITMGFGYGSLRDCTVVRSLIHDHCSIDWQKSWKGHMDSKRRFSDHDYDEKGRFIKKSTEYKKDYLKREKEYEQNSYK